MLFAAISLAVVVGLDIYIGQGACPMLVQGFSGHMSCWLSCNSHEAPTKHARIVLGLKK